MGLIESWNNYHNRVGEAVGGVANVASQNSAIAAAVVGAMCNIASKYPQTWAAPPYARGWVNGACSASSLNGFPPPSPVPRGGQCNENYDVDYSVFGSTEQEFNRVKSIRGPILDIYLAGGIVYYKTKRGNPPQEAIFVFDNAGPYTRLEVRGYTLIEGGEDLCGDSPEHYPPDPPPDPDDFNFDITFEDGTSLSVSLEGDISGAPGLTFSGDGVSISVGGDGISVDVDSGGAVEGGDGTEEKDFNAEDFEPEPGEETEEESQVDPAIAWVVVRVTQDPPARKIITFADAQDRHMFAGYFCWTVSLDDQQYHLPYKTITKPYNAYKAPSGATGYRAYTTNGAKIQTVVYKERTEE